MGQATLLTPTHAHIEGVETGALFAQRHAERIAVGGGPVGVVPALRSLFSAGGFERGHMYGISGATSLSLLFVLTAEATTNGSWLAIVNTPQAGLMAAHEYGVALHRVVTVQSESAYVGKVLGALVDGFDLVAVSSPTCSVADARKIAARVKAQGSVLLVLGKPGSFEVDATVNAHVGQWVFNTHAVARTVQVDVQGRRVHQRRSCEVLLPSPSGAIAEC